MLGGCGRPAALNFLYYARSAQSVTGMSRLVFHASVVLLCSEDRFDIAKSNTHPARIPSGSSPSSVSTSISAAARLAAWQCSPRSGMPRRAESPKLLAAAHRRQGQTPSRTSAASVENSPCHCLGCFARSLATTRTICPRVSSVGGQMSWRRWRVSAIASTAPPHSPALTSL
jgi:hypothetical protein